METLFRFSSHVSYPYCTKRLTVNETYSDYSYCCLGCGFTNVASNGCKRFRLEFQIDKIEGADPESYSTGGSTLSYFDAMLMKDGNFTHMITAKNGQFYNRDFEVEYFTSIRFLPVAFIFAQTGYVLRATKDPPTWTG